MLLAADNITDGDLSVDSFWSALGVALVASAVSVVLDVVFGTNDDDAYTLRVIQRIAKRSDDRVETDAPGIIYLEIDGLALPVLQRAMRDGNAPNMARWLVEGGYTLTEWETDLSSQTGASQAGILLGSNEDIPAFRWVEKETATTMACSAPPDCAEIERRHAGHGLLRDGGASRGNLLSGEADHCILTVSRMEEEKKANPGYRAFLANGFNVTRRLRPPLLGGHARALRLEPREAARRAAAGPPRRLLPAHARRALRVRARPDRLRRPPGHDEGPARDLRDVLELRRGRASLRPRARRHARGAAQARPAVRPDRGAPASYAPRPYAIVVLSDHGQTQGATFKQRNGYGLDELVERSLSRGSVGGMSGGDEQSSMVGHALGEATGAAGKKEKRKKNDVSDKDVVVMGSGNLGLVYLMEERRRLTLEEMNERHPDLIPALRNHPTSAGCSSAPPSTGPSCSAATARAISPTGGSRARIRSPPSRRTPRRHLLRTDGFTHVADIMIGSFYDPSLETGCAFEELISFHGGIGGPQTRPFILHPDELAVPAGEILGAAAVHEILLGWRRELNGTTAPARGRAPQRDAMSAVHVLLYAVAPRPARSS